MANGDENNNNNELPLYGEYTIDNMMQQAKNIHQFCDLVRNMSRNNAETALHVLVNKKGCTAEDRMQIYELIRYLLIEKEYFHIYPENLKYDNNFKQFISQHISNVFRFNDDDNELKRVKILTQFLYDDKFRPKFIDLPKYEAISSYHNDQFTDDTQQNVNNEELFRNECILKQTQCFQELLCSIDAELMNMVMSKVTFVYDYLNPKIRSPFSDGPVALLFSGGFKEDFNKLYRDDFNCYIFSQLLFEMGYNKENIMCFIKGKSFKNNIQIKTFKDNSQTSSQNFKNLFRFLLFTDQFASNQIFEYSILKTSFDAKGPIFVYYSHCENKDSIFFDLFNEERFLYLCGVLDTFRKHILIILDCYISEEFNSNFQFNYVHLISYSFNKPNKSNLEDEEVKFNSDDLPINGINFNLTPYILDSIYKIKPGTSLNDFVEIINSNGCEAFKAKLYSRNLSLPVSMFFQSPTFKYLNYFNLENLFGYDYFLEKSEVINEIETSQVKVKEDLFTYEIDPIHEEIENSLIEQFGDSLDFGLLPKYNSLLSEEEERTAQRHLRNEDAIFVINETVKKFTMSPQALEEKKKQKKGKLLHKSVIYSWFLQYYRLETRPYMHAAKLLKLSFYPDEFEEVKGFMKSLAEDLMSNYNDDDNYVEEEYNLR